MYSKDDDDDVLGLSMFSKDDDDEDDIGLSSYSKDDGDDDVLGLRCTLKMIMMMMF